MVRSFPFHVVSNRGARQGGADMCNWFLILFLAAARLDLFRLKTFP